MTCMSLIAITLVLAKHKPMLNVVAPSTRSVATAGEICGAASAAGVRGRRSAGDVTGDVMGATDMRSDRPYFDFGARPLDGALCLSSTAICGRSAPSTGCTLVK